MTKIAIVGATSSIGRELLTFFEIDNVSKENIFAVDVKAPLGTMVSYGEDHDLDVYNLDDFDFGKVEYAIFATSKPISKKFVSKAIAKNVKVVDASGQFITDTDVPLIVAGVNDRDIKKAKKGIVSIPSPLATQILTPLKEIDNKYNITRIVSNSYVSTSYYGTEAMDELFNQTKKIFGNQQIVDNQQVFNKQIAFNVIPQVDEFIGDETYLEWAVNVEVKKVLHLDVKVHANCAFVPTFVGIGQFVNIECEEDIDIDEAKGIMEQADGVVIFDKNLDGGYFSMSDVQGEDNLYISRLRQDVSVESGISFWSVSDNLRFGIARNAYKTLKVFMNN